MYITPIILLLFVSTVIKGRKEKPERSATKVVVKHQVMQWELKIPGIGGA